MKRVDGAAGVAWIRSVRRKSVDVGSRPEAIGCAIGAELPEVVIEAAVLLHHEHNMLEYLLGTGFTPTTSSGQSHARTQRQQRHTERQGGISSPHDEPSPAIPDLVAVLS